MKTKNHGPEPTQTDSGLYSEAEPPADAGPQRSTDAGGPYTDEELREAREHMARCADREFISVVEFRRLLATLDERDRQLAEAMPPRALREWREALGEYAPEDTGGWSPLVGVTRAVVRLLEWRGTQAAEADGLRRALYDARREAASLREEVARWHEAYREVCAAVGPHLGPPVGDKPLPRGVVEAARTMGGVADTWRNEAMRLRAARAAAERRAEEARAAALEEAARVCDAGAGRDQARADDLEQREDYEAAHVWDNSATTFREAARRIRVLAAPHPPQQQTPAPADRCLVCEHKDLDLSVSDRENEALRSRVRELEGRLREALRAAACSLYFDDGSKHRAHLWDVVHAIDPRVAMALDAGTWRPYPDDPDKAVDGQLIDDGRDAATAEAVTAIREAGLRKLREHLAARAALPSQEQPAAPALPPPPTGCRCTGDHHVEGCPFGAPPSTPEGEQADDDADPSRWEPGDVVQEGGDEDSRSRVLQNDLATKCPRILLCDDEYPEEGSWWQMDFEGWRRIRRAGEVDRG